jgi:lipopolysaccharide/colanic/teichoic acid biosynthesis glycosyltransferase
MIHREDQEDTRLTKRLFDIAVSSVALVALAPLLIAIAIAVKMNSRGPAMYAGVRVGRHGRDFKILKFRSMVMNAESIGGSATANDDPRITTIGRVLRRYKIDELPQLINVWRGDMSLVGPRPEVRKYVATYTDEQRSLLELRPGITDWATIWNSDEGTVLAGSGNPEADYEAFIRPTKLELQTKYWNRHSMAIDLTIIGHTLVKLIHKTWTPKELASYRPACIYSHREGGKAEC